jgi:hypothetical protein
MGVVSRTIGVGSVPGQVTITTDGEYTYEADMDGVSLTKSTSGMASKILKTGAVIAVGSSPNRGDLSGRRCPSTLRGVSD